MIRNIKVINSVKPEIILQHMISSKKRSMILNSLSELSKPSLTTSFINSQRTFSTTCRHCNFTFNYQSLDRLHLLSSAHIMRIDYSSFITESSTCFRIQETQKRYKSKKPQKRPEYDSDSDEEDKDEDDALSKAAKPMKLRVQSLRMDGLLKKALGVARNKVETAFYEGSIRVNGTRPAKKSYQVKEGDEVDLIKGISPMNPDFLMISRIEILSVTEDPDEEDELVVKLRRTKTMYVENYENDPWKKSSSSE